MAQLSQQRLNRVRRWRIGALEDFLKKHGTRKVLIWSAQWSMYWREGGAGYMNRVSEAGIYTLRDAWNRTCHCGPEKGIHYDLA